MAKELFLEIGTEEIPAGFIEPALRAVAETADTLMATARLPFGEIRTYGTPRRLVLVIAGLGAASDPVTLNPDAADWVEYHWGLAMLGIVVIGGCLLAQVALIGQNYELINEILVAAERERERRNAAREPAAEG